MKEQKNIGERLFEARTRLGISQTEFAKYFNVNQSTMNRWENGKIKIGKRTLFWIEHVLSQLGFVYAYRQREASE